MLDEDAESSESAKVEERRKPIKLKRPFQMSGETYKIKDPARDITIYATITDRDGKPWEIFLNSSHLESFQWVAGLTRVISLMFRKGIPADEIVNELDQIFNYYSYMGQVGDSEKPRTTNSLVAHVGKVIKYHCKMIEEKKNAKQEGEQVSETNKVEEEEEQEKLDSDTTEAKGKKTGGLECPECKQDTMIKEGGCTRCTDDACGYMGECG